MSDETETANTETSNTDSTMSNTVPTVTVTSDEEAAAYQSAVDAYNLQKAQEAAEARAEKLKPITDLLATSEWTSVKNGISDLTGKFDDEPGIAPHINALAMIMPALEGAVR